MGSQAGIVAFLVVGEQGVEDINIPFGARAPLNNTVMLRLSGGSAIKAGLHRIVDHLSSSPNAECRPA